MGACDQIRPLLYTYIEREAEPAEAMVVANHVASCTACKILLARKRRLARMLEEGLQDCLPVGEDFVQSVMQTLPEGPPPRRRRRGRQRGLRLAGLVGLLFLLGQAAALRVRFGAPVLPRPPWTAAASSGAWSDHWVEPLRWAATAVETLAGAGAWDLSLPGAALASAALLVGSLLVVGAATSTAIALAARSLLRSRRG